MVSYRRDCGLRPVPLTLVSPLPCFQAWLNRPIQTQISHRMEPRITIVISHARCSTASRLRHCARSRCVGGETTSLSWPESVELTYGYRAELRYRALGLTSRFVEREYLRRDRRGASVVGTVV